MDLCELQRERMLNSSGSGEGPVTKYFKIFCSKDAGNSSIYTPVPFYQTIRRHIPLIYIIVAVIICIHSV
jgi:hypothetical protein